MKKVKIVGPFGSKAGQAHGPFNGKAKLRGPLGQKVKKVPGPFTRKGDKSLFLWKKKARGRLGA